jgi:hypothetical protein
MIGDSAVFGPTHRSHNSVTTPYSYAAKTMPLYGLVTSTSYLHPAPLPAMALKAAEFGTPLAIALEHLSLLGGSQHLAVRGLFACLLSNDPERWCCSKPLCQAASGPRRPESRASQPATVICPISLSRLPPQVSIKPLQPVRFRNLLTATPYFN